MEFFEVKNKKIRYELYGKDDASIKVVLVMGLATSLESWESQANFFKDPSNQCQAVAFDNVGVGYSSVPSFPLGHSITAMAEDTVNLASHLGWPVFHLVGISMGGMICLEISSRYPSRLQSLTLMNTHGGGLMTNLFPPPEGSYLLTKSLFTKDQKEKLKYLLPLLYGSKTLNNPVKRKELIDFRTNMLEKKVPLPTFRGIFSHFVAVSTHLISGQRLEKIKKSGIPIMICVGTEDCLISAKNSYYLHQKLGGTLKIFEGGHAIPTEFKDEVNQSLLSHFKAAHNRKIVQNDFINHRDRYWMIGGWLFLLLTPFGWFILFLVWCRQNLGLLFKRKVYNI